MVIPFGDATAFEKKINRSISSGWFMLYNFFSMWPRWCVCVFFWVGVLHLFSFSWDADK
jgi:hypothetical protein